MSNNVNLAKYCIRKLYHFIIAPFAQNLPLFGALLVIQFIQFFVLRTLVGPTGIVCLLASVAWAYGLTLPQGFNNKIWRRIYATIILIFAGFCGIMQIFCCVKLEDLVYSTHIQLITNTNPEEAGEFLTTFVDCKVTGYILLAGILSIGMYQLGRYIKRFHFIYKIAPFLAFFAIIGGVLTTCTSQWYNNGIGRVVSSIRNVASIRQYDLKATQRNFDVCEKETLHPNIVLIMGESFDKAHSNLYGYDKLTNPLLTKRAKNGTLTVFDSVQSSASCTHLSMMQMFTLCESINDPDWYTRPTLLTALRKAGYYTAWLSNQSPISVSENIQGQFGKLCDTCYFTRDNMKELSHHDENLLAPFNYLIAQNKKKEKQFYVLHLIGSHAKFSKRYPERFNKFKESDYLNQAEDRRNNFATYDNSILYNDFVVDSIMKLADQMDAIVIYLADHGLDFYYTRNVATHGNLSNPKSALLSSQIPFFIYYTEKFRQNNPEVIQNINGYTKEPFKTKYLINTILEIAGYDICDYQLFGKSLFKGNLYDKIGNKVALTPPN